jgi:hypothetical protein
MKDEENDCWLSKLVGSHRIGSHGLVFFHHSSLILHPSLSVARENTQGCR